MQTTPPSKLTCNNGQANLGGSSDEYVENSLMSQNIADYIYSQKVENAYLRMAYLSPLLDWAKRTDSGSLIDSINKYE